MPRAIWTGSLSFGLVSIPVGLYAATQEHEVHFHQFERGTNSRIRYRRVNQDTGDEVEYSDIVKGAEVGDGEYVQLTDEELESVQPERTRTIEITDFVELADIDPIYFRTGYYLAPRDDGARKPYALLAAAAEKSGRAGVATFVLRNKEHLAVIRPYRQVLLLETMFFADEIRDAGGVVQNAPDTSDLPRRDVQMAVDLIEAMTTGWQPGNYTDSYAERVQELVEAKSRDETIEVGDEEDTGAEVVDLTSALRASVEQARGRGPAKRSGSGRQDRSNEPAELSELSKAELYELAQQHGISGRSSMNRKQLERALAETLRDGSGAAAS